MPIKEQIKDKALTARYAKSSSCSDWTWAFREDICLLVLSWLATTLFFMFLARLAYFSVLSVSMKSLSLGDTHAIITVRLKQQWSTFVLATIQSTSILLNQFYLTHCITLVYLCISKHFPFYLLPPSESCKSRVSLESRYGTWLPRLSLSPKAEITLPRASYNTPNH